MDGFIGWVSLFCSILIVDPPWDKDESLYIYTHIIYWPNIVESNPDEILSGFLSLGCLVAWGVTVFDFDTFHSFQWYDVLY